MTNAQKDAFYFLIGVIDEYLYDATNGEFIDEVNRNKEIVINMFLKPEGDTK